MTDAPRSSSRTPLVLSGLALAVAVAGTGGPAIARAIAPNADKVDGFHAVGAKAGDAKRAKKLVATNGQGRLPDGAINPELAFPDEVPPGVTVRGVWSILDMDQTAAEDGSWGTSFSFPASIQGPLTSQLVTVPAYTESCPGVTPAPQAAPGYLCIYVEVENGPVLTGDSIDVWDEGVFMWLGDDNGRVDQIFYQGSWAATAPTG